MNHACYLDSPSKEELPDLLAQNLNFVSFKKSKRVGGDLGSFDNLIVTHTSATTALNQGSNIPTLTHFCKFLHTHNTFFFFLSFLLPFNRATAEEDISFFGKY